MRNQSSSALVNTTWSRGIVSNANRSANSCALISARGAEAAPLTQQADHTLRVNALLAVGVEPSVAVPLGEPATVLADDHWQVGVLDGNTRTLTLWARQGLANQLLTVRGVQQVVAADDVRDALPRVIDHHSQLVCRQADLGGDDKITDRLLHVVGHVAPQRVADGQRLVGRPQSPSRAGVHGVVEVDGRHLGRPARAGVAQLVIAGVGRREAGRDEL